MWGSAPHIPIPYVGVRGAQPRHTVSPAGRGAPLCRFPERLSVSARDAHVVLLRHAVPGYAVDPARHAETVCDLKRSDGARRGVVIIPARRYICVRIVKQASRAVGVERLRIIHSRRAARPS